MDPPSATYSPASCQIAMMKTSTDQAIAYEQQAGRRQSPVRGAMYNHYYYGPVNRIGQASNSSFGTNYGRIDQVMHPDATSAHSRGLPTWHSTDVFSLLNPILDASHTRNMNISPPNSQCLPGTRKDVIRDIQMWADSDLDTNPHMLWIFGYAGCGKSAIAHEIAKYYARQGRLAASFAFFRGSGDRSTVARFATTVASQVAAAVPETEPYIESTVRRCPGLLSTNTASLSDQFERLVYLPIHAIASRASAPFVIVLDGIDECQDGTDISMLIEAMIDFFNRQARTPLRFLITSRVEDHLHQVLHSSNQVRLLNLVEKTSDADIASALTVAIQKEARGQVLSRHGPWPSAEDKERLVKHIGGSFIFMSTIVKRLFDRSIKDVRTPMERLPLVLSMKPDFDDLYKEILTPCQHFSHFHAVMNTLILAFRPLSVAEVADIISIKTYDVANVLINMQAIIQVPGDDRTPVTLWHTSLRDYLTAENRSGPLAANPSHQRWLAYRCVSLAAASAKATYHPSLAYSQEYAVGHLAKLVKISTTDQSLELLVHELQKVMGALQMPVYKGTLNIQCL